MCCMGAAGPPAHGRMPRAAADAAARRRRASRRARAPGPNPELTSARACGPAARRAAQFAPPRARRPRAQGSSPDTHLGLAQAYGSAYLSTPNAYSELPMYRSVSASTGSASGSVEAYQRMAEEVAASAAQVPP
jgi:hypothetical protein